MIAIQKFLNNHYGKIVFLNLPYASSLELYEILSYFLKMHPEIKTVLVSLEYQGYIKCYSERKASKPGNLCSDIIKLYFSFDSTKKSLKYFYNDILLYLKTRNKDKKENMNFHQTGNQSENLDRNKNITHNEQAGNINPEQIKEPDNKFLFLYNEKRHYCFNEITCEHDGIKNVRKIYNFLKDRNIKAVYFIPPSHANYLSLLYLDHKYSTIETFKRGIASITPFYDMSFVNYYTAHSFKYFWQDVFHPNYSILGKKISSCIFENQIDENLTVYVTQSNVNDVLKKQRMDLIKYVNQNIEYLHKYNHNRYDVGVNKYDVYVYFKDIKNTEYEKLYFESKE